MSKDSQRRRRNKLYDEDPACRLCRTVTIPPEELAAKYGNPNKAPAYERNMMATIEHIYSRIDGPRPRHGALTLLCWLCNQERSVREVRALGIAEQRRRSRRLGRSFTDPGTP